MSDEDICLLHHQVQSVQKKKKVKLSL
jgi:hypothetical protein